jgi:hypothetical protein
VSLGYVGLILKKDDHIYISWSLIIKPLGMVGKFNMVPKGESSNQFLRLIISVHKISHYFSEQINFLELLLPVTNVSAVLIN